MEDIVYQTSSLPLSEAIAHWGDVFCKHVLHADPVFVKPESFGVEFALKPIDRLALLRADMRSIEHHRTARHVSHDGDRDISFMFAERGMMLCDSNGGVTRADRQAAVFGGHDRTHAGHWDDARMFSIEIPAAALAEAGAPDPRCYQEVARSDPLVRLLHRYARFVWSLDSGARTAGAALIEEHLTRLTVEAMRHASPAGSRLAGEAAVAVALEALIDAQFRDPELSVVSAATRLNIPIRTIAPAMALTGQTFRDRLRERRLMEAQYLLRISPRARIIDIALACGFSDVSYFVRCFRARFGAAPSAWAAQIPG